jgi:hypothetical protein
MQNMIAQAQSQLENSVFAVVKISYNQPGETPVTGGICGTAFLINDSTAMTSNHVLNCDNFKPNPDFKFAQYWLIKRASQIVIPLNKDYFESFEDIETTLISLPEKLESNFNLIKQSINLNDSVFNFGHISNMPITKAHWENNYLVIDEYNLTKSKSDRSGIIKEIKKVSINAPDVKLNDMTIIQPSFKANIGMSGGPLIRGDDLIGLMSFGLPPDSTIKDVVYAISINEIVDKLNNK